MSIPGSLLLARNTDLCRCVTGGCWCLLEICPHLSLIPVEWGSCQLCCTSRSSLSLFLKNRHGQFPSCAAMVMPAATPGGPTAQQGEGRLGLGQPHSSNASLWAGGCPGKEREKGRHSEILVPGRSFWVRAPPLPSPVAEVSPALCSLSLSIFIKFTGMSLSETPTLCQTYLVGVNRNILGGKTCRSVQSLLVQAVFLQESGMSPSSFLPSSWESPVLAAPSACGAEPWVAAAQSRSRDTAGDSHGPLPGDPV